MTWTANYQPLADSALASAGISVIPIIILFVMLFMTRVIYAAIVAVAATIIVACALYGMPVGMAFLAACNGFLFGAWPICLIVFAAISLYDLTVVTGKFDVVKYTIVSLTKDKRLLTLLLAYAFSGFIEGASGFSTPVALTSAMMIGVGFTKVEAAKAALIGNTIPVVFGGIGIPTVTLGTVTRLDASVLGVAATRLLIPFSFIMPWILVYSISSFKHTLEVWPACLLTSVVQTGMSLLIAQFVGPQTVSIVSMLVTLASLGILVKFWHPKHILMTDAMLKEEVGVGGSLGVQDAAAPQTVEEKTAAAIEAADAPAKVAADATTTTTTTTTTTNAQTPQKAPADAADAADAAIHTPQPHAHPVMSSTSDPRPKLTAHLSLSAMAAHRHPLTAGSMSARLPPAHVLSPGHKAVVLRRVAVHPHGHRKLDSSSIATALFPHSRDHAGSTLAEAPTPLRDNLVQRMKSLKFFTPSRAPGRSASAGPAAGGRGAPSSPRVAPMAALELPPSAPPATAEATAAPTHTNSDPSSPQAGQPTPPATTSALPADAHAIAVVTPGKAEAKAAAAAAAAGGHGGGAGNDHAKEARGQEAEVKVHYDALHPPSRNDVLLAWAPWLLVCVLVSTWGSPPVKAGLSVGTIQVPITGLDGQVQKPSPTGEGAPHAVAAKWQVDLIGATGICLLLCGVLTSILYRVPPMKTARVFAKSFKRMALSFLTVCILLSFGYVLKFSGQDTALGLAAANAAQGYPFVGSIIGFVGVALTGSATTSNVIFGSLQTVAADKIGLNPVQMAATNVAAGILGHIISTSSMVVASVSTGDDGKDISKIARSVIGYGLGLLVAFGAWNEIVAYVFPGFIPSSNYY